MAKNFKDLSEPEILALAISNEETDGRIYADFAARSKTTTRRLLSFSKKWRPRKTLTGSG
jgi:hypothetical protein